MQINAGRVTNETHAHDCMTANCLVSLFPQSHVTTVAQMCSTVQQNMILGCSVHLEGCDLAVGQLLLPVEGGRAVVGQHFACMIDVAAWQ